MAKDFTATIAVYTLELKHRRKQTSTHTHTKCTQQLPANRIDVKTPRCYLKVTIQHCSSHCCFISLLSLSPLSVYLSLSFLLFIFLTVNTPPPLYLYRQATHPNMRTYYFCTDTAKEMESWMKVMTDAALVHTEPVRRWVLDVGTSTHRS